jgi:SAM-dependent methyltransferase
LRFSWLINENQSDARKMHRDALALLAYETLAEQYSALAPTKPHNAYYNRPAMLSLLPALQGKRVFDAGCGPGIDSDWFVGQGASVVGCDVSPKMIELAEARLQGRARFFVADLAGPLAFLDDASWDIVFSSLVLEHISDWLAVFKEFRRVLKPGGLLLFSAGHPSDEFYEHHPHGNYFDVEQVQYEWRGFGSPVMVPSYRRPFSAMVNPLIEAGFVLERILEPQPVEAFRDQDPQDYEKLTRRPGFICFRARTEKSP